MQWPLIFNHVRRSVESLSVTERNVPLVFIRNLLARRYVLRLRPDGSARVTIPRGGSVALARQFAERQIPWIERQLGRLLTHPRRPIEWRAGTEILFHGEPVPLQAVTDQSAQIRFGSEVLNVADLNADLRPAIENYLWKLAAKELPPLVFARAVQHGLTVRRVTVRNQKSRWGSCSRRGTISLNWRLIQAPSFVCDYIILHELMHLREMNHSIRFWREVKFVCPDYEIAEQWLKQNVALLK